tara:strand:+ start:140 stop:442 length:303 start_codon:yes stop_codon:yes gene_type:complete
MVKGVLMEDYLTGNRSFIKNSYAQLLLYYYNKGTGNISEIAGAIITDKLINAVERRYKQLGGNPAMLRVGNYRPSKNGQSKKENQRDERKQPKINRKRSL